MGAETSHLPPLAAGANLFTVTFRRPDKIIFTHAEEPQISAVAEILKHSWTYGLSNDEMGPNHGGYQIKLKGSPFDKGSTREEATSIKLCLCQALHKFAGMGWSPLVSSDLSRTYDHSTIFFQKSRETGVSSTPENIICLSISGRNALQLINHQNDLCLISALEQSIKESYTYGSKKVATTQNGSLYEVQLYGDPWTELGSKEVGVAVRKLLLNLFLRFERDLRFVFYSQADLKGTSDCLFFVRNRNVLRNQLDLERPTLEQDFFLLSLNNTDRIRLIQANRLVIDKVRNVLKLYWGKGIQWEGEYYGSYEFQLSGTPFHAEGDEAVSIRYLLAILFQELIRGGCSLICTMDISRKMTDKSVFIWKSANINPELYPCMLPLVACLSLNMTEIIRLIRFPPVDQLAIINAVTGHWVQGFDQQEYSAHVQLKLRGNPWGSYSKSDDMQGRSLLCAIIHELQQRGWKVISSADVSAKWINIYRGEDHPEDVHSLFFVKHFAQMHHYPPSYSAELLDAPPEYQP